MHMLGPSQGTQFDVLSESKTYQAVGAQFLPEFRFGHPSLQVHVTLVLDGYLSKLFSTSKSY